MPIKLSREDAEQAREVFDSNQKDIKVLEAKKARAFETLKRTTEKITNLDDLLIKKKHENTMENLGHKFGVTRNHMGSILRNRYWNPDTEGGPQPQQENVGP